MFDSHLQSQDCTNTRVFFFFKVHKLNGRIEDNGEQLAEIDSVWD